MIIYEQNQHFIDLLVDTCAMPRLFYFRGSKSMSCDVCE